MEATTKKKLLFAGLATAALLVVNQAVAAKETIAGLRFKFGYGGAPQISGLKIVFPVLVTVENPGDVTLPLQGLAMTMQRLYTNNALSAPIAATDPAGVVTPNIGARMSTNFIVPINTDFLSVITEVVSMIKNRGLGRYRLNTSIISAGVRINLPPENLTF